MNVLQVEPTDFVSRDISLATLKKAYQTYLPFQDFVWMPWMGGILILKNRHGPTGIFFSE